MVILVLLREFRFKTIEVDSGVEWLQIFLVVSLSVELKDLNLKLLDILQNHIN